VPTRTTRPRWPRSSRQRRTRSSAAARRQGLRLKTRGAWKTAIIFNKYFRKIVFLKYYYVWLFYTKFYDNIDFQNIYRPCSMMLGWLALNKMILKYSCNF
jgi:hypothetical protein